MNNLPPPPGASAAPTQEPQLEFIAFNRPYLVGTETSYVEQAVAKGHLSTGGEFTQACEKWLVERTGCRQALLANSCTAALEASALLLELGPGDEVIMPSFTFVTTASAFALRGATPVFVDIRPDTLTLDVESVRDAITPATKAIVAVHYGGVSCDMDELLRLGREHGIPVMEDAAQGLLASYRGKPLGSMGSLGALSFHETKNVTCGEGGALLVNDATVADRAEIVWDKGTDRRSFERGEVDKYTWVELGSSFGASDLAAAFLWGQLGQAEEITSRRRRIWDAYHEALADAEAAGCLRRPIVPGDREHNAHMYYLLLGDEPARGRFIAAMGARRILAVFHYVPLHSSPAGRRIGRAHGELAVSEEVASRLVRLPLWAGMSDDAIERVILAAREAVGIATTR